MRGLRATIIAKVSSSDGTRNPGGSGIGRILLRCEAAWTGALESDEFMRSLHKTMSGFFRLGRWSLLLPYDRWRTKRRELVDGISLPSCRHSYNLTTGRQLPDSLAEHV